MNDAIGSIIKYLVVLVIGAAISYFYMQGQNRGLQDEIGALQSQVAEQTKAADDAAASLAAATEELSAKTAMADEASAKAADAAARVEELTAKVAEQEAAIADLQAKLDAAPAQQ